MPYVGELIGASQRETSYEKLVEIMFTKGIKREPLEFYLDLRKYGSCEHGGFGLGCDRLLMFLTGVHNIKDVIPFPVSYTNCNY
jgi:asparaginyl-tRNA synthetase